MSIVERKADPERGAGSIPAETLEFVRTVRAQVGTVVVGQDVVVERLLIALFTGGHLLLQGVPGLAKTLLVATLSKTIDLHFARIQFTVNLLPSDIIGSEILDQRTNDFRVHKGPIFTNLLLADEINRAAPKVQSALLEAMQERRVTIGNETFKLPAPFLVIATQNPIEQSGTFELPEAQLDRFMLCHRLVYPDRGRGKRDPETQRRAGRPPRGPRGRRSHRVRRPGGRPRRHHRRPRPRHGGRPQIYVSETFTDHVVEIVTRTRNHPCIELGASPRAGIALIKGSRARALIHGRNYVIPEDLFALAEDVILHRTRLTYEALADGRTGSDILKEILGPYRHNREDARITQRQGPLSATAARCFVSRKETHDEHGFEVERARP